MNRWGRPGVTAQDVADGLREARQRLQREQKKLGIPVVGYVSRRDMPDEKGKYRCTSHGCEKIVDGPRQTCWRCEEAATEETGQQRKARLAATSDLRVCKRCSMIRKHEGGRQWCLDCCGEMSRRTLLGHEKRRQQKDAA